MLNEIVNNDVAAMQAPSQGEIERAEALKKGQGEPLEGGAPAPVAAEEAERAERQSRIFARRIARTLRNATGDDVTPDEAEEIAEIGGAIFRGLLRIPFGGMIGGAIIAVCVAIPFMPRILKFTAKKEEKPA